MGNIGFREGGSSPSAVGFQEGEQLNMEFAEGGGHASFHTNCPRTIPSPSALISTSQNAWMQPTIQCEHMAGEQGILTMLTWSYGGNEVAIEGSWDNWEAREPLQRSGIGFAIMKVLLLGIYHYHFIVDGRRTYDPEMPCMHDDVGNVFNILDLKGSIPENSESISGFEPPVSPESSYNNSELGVEDFVKDPPLLPSQLEITPLNVPHSMLRPQHVVLNHLYMRKRVKNGPSAAALGSTHRFLDKYVTVLLFKPIKANR